MSSLENGSPSYPERDSGLGTESWRLSFPDLVVGTYTNELIQLLSLRLSKSSTFFCRLHGFLTSFPNRNYSYLSIFHGIDIHPSLASVKNMGGI